MSTEWKTYQDDLKNDLAYEGILWLGSCPLFDVAGIYSFITGYLGKGTLSF